MSNKKEVESLVKMRGPDINSELDVIIDVLKKSVSDFGVVPLTNTWLLHLLEKAKEQYYAEGNVTYLMMVKGETK